MCLSNEYQQLCNWLCLLFWVKFTMFFFVFLYIKKSLATYLMFFCFFLQVTLFIALTLISAIFQEPTHSPTFLSGKYLSSSVEDNNAAPILPCFILKQRTQDTRGIQKSVFAIFTTGYSKCTCIVGLYEW